MIPWNDLLETLFHCCRANVSQSANQLITNNTDWYRFVVLSHKKSLREHELVFSRHCNRRVILLSAQEPHSQRKFHPEITGIFSMVRSCVVEDDITETATEQFYTQGAKVQRVKFLLIFLSGWTKRGSVAISRTKTWSQTTQKASMLSSWTILDYILVIGLKVHFATFLRAVNIKRDRALNAIYSSLC